MKNEELEELFCAKISLEIRRFKEKLVKEEQPETVYEKAYQIDCMINIYELLLEMSRKIEDKTLRKLMVIPGLLALFYDRWLDTEDSHVEELTECLENSIKEMETQDKLQEKEDDVA